MKEKGDGDRKGEWELQSARTLCLQPRQRGINVSWKAGTMSRMNR